MTKPAHLAYKLRYLLLAASIIATLTALACCLWLTDFYAPVWYCTAIFLFLQFIFLSPRHNWPLFLTKDARPLRRSILIAALVAAFLTAAAIATLLETLDVWRDFSSLLSGLLPLAILAALWLLWTPIFWLLLKKEDRYASLSRIVRRLIAGTILELFVSVTVQILVPDRHNCFCDRGSFLGILIAGPILIWTFGPALALVFAYEKVRMQRAYKSNLCPSCDFDLTGTRAANLTQCPECGHPIPPL